MCEKVRSVTSCSSKIALATTDQVKAPSFNMYLGYPKLEGRRLANLPPLASLCELELLSGLGLVGKDWMEDAGSRNLLAFSFASSAFFLSSLASHLSRRRVSAEVPVRCVKLSLPIKSRKQILTREGKFVKKKR